MRGGVDGLEHFGEHERAGKKVMVTSALITRRTPSSAKRSRVTAGGVPVGLPLPPDGV